MEETEAVKFLFTMVKEYKQFLETPIVLFTEVDYADKIFDALCEMRTALLVHRSPQEARGVICKVHRGWLTAVADIEAFRRRIRDTPRDSIYRCVDFTINAVAKRLKYFRQYMRSLEATMSEKQLITMGTDIEVIQDMHAAIEGVLLDKKTCIKGYTDATEFAIKISDECEELLNWLDKMSDSVSLRFAELVGGVVPQLSSRLQNTLQDIIQKCKEDAGGSTTDLMEKLHDTERHLSSTMRTSNAHDLEASKVMEKIATLTERINLLSCGNSSAVMALRHKKLYLEEQLHSLLEIHSHLRALQEGDHGAGYPRGIIFDHKLPEAERDNLVSALIEEWNSAICSSKPHRRRSIVSILSNTDIQKELFADSWGNFFVDRFGRKLYTRNDDDNMYQLNDSNDLVPLSDDDGHVYYYDDCGRYYLDRGQLRVYKAHRTASEYILDVSGVMLKVREEIEGVVYHYDSYGRYYVDRNDKHIYKEADGCSEYESDGLGNLVRIEKEDSLIEQPDLKAAMTAEADYLRRAVGDALKVCIADAIVHRPAEPILYLAQRLLRYRAQAEAAARREGEAKEWAAAREARAAEEAAESEGAEGPAASRGGSEATFDTNMVLYESPDNVIQQI